MVNHISKASAILLLLSFSLLFWTPASSQLMKFDAPLSQLYQNGLKSLQQGDIHIIVNVYIFYVIFDFYSLFKVESSLVFLKICLHACRIAP